MKRLFAELIYGSRKLNDIMEFSRHVLKIPVILCGLSILQCIVGAKFAASYCCEDRGYLSD